MNRKREEHIYMRKRKRKYFRRVTPGLVLLYIVMILLAAFMALPLIYLVVTAFKPLDELLLFPPRFFVKKPTLQNFSSLLGTLDSKVVPFTRYLFNSVVTTVCSVAGTVLVCSMGAYSAEKLHLRGMKTFSRIVVYALMYSAPASQIPIYLIVSKAGMLDNYLSLIIPKFAIPMYFFLYQQFVSQIPDELLDSAKLDGCGTFATFRKIVLPLTKSATSTIVVFSFIANWNDSFGPMIYITSQAKKTLPIVLQSIADGGIARMGAAAAATFLTTAPVILIYVFMQSRVLQTMEYSGIKG